MSTTNAMATGGHGGDGKAPSASTGRGPAPLYTVGIDVGSGCVKTVLFKDGNWVAKRVERIRRRDPLELAKQGYDLSLIHI